MKTKIEEINMYNDHLFKSLVRSIEARNIVSSFLSKLTGIEKEKLYNASYQGGEIPKSNKNEKSKASDVIVKIDDSHHIVIEMNQYDTPNLMNKNVNYALSDIVKNSKSKSRYCKVYLINIDNFNKYNRKDPILYFNIMNKYGDKESEVYESIHVVLDNFVNMKYNIDSEIEKFVKLLSMKNIEEMKEKFSEDKNYMSAIEKVEEYMKDEEFIGVYDLEERRKWEMDEMKLAGLQEGIAEGLAQGIEQGIEKGIEKGKNEEKRELAKKMKDKKMDINTIAELTGLTIQEINTL